MRSSDTRTNFDRHPPEASSCPQEFFSSRLYLSSGYSVFSLAHVFAQETTRIATLDIPVRPEYARPGVLVQYQGQIAGADKSGVSYEICVLVPKGAGVGAACGIQSDGNHASVTRKESDARSHSLLFSLCPGRTARRGFHAVGSASSAAVRRNRMIDFAPGVGRKGGRWSNSRVVRWSYSQGHRSLNDTVAA